MKKALKCLAVLAAIGAVIGVIIAFLCKNQEEDDNCVFDSDDEDFDLDSDLQEVDRSYVSLTKPSTEEAAQDQETTADSADTAMS